jgi:pimeloyl-ACP methyl ester carboxylesterase
MKGQFITYQGQLIHYYKMGHGPQIILAFHGFGLDGTSFEPFENQLSEEYTLYCFDLFYHGKSFWKDNNETLTKTFWKNFLTYFLKDHTENFSLMSFSMGGKFALATIESFPGRIDKVFFIAPDGIKTQMWYSLATYPTFFRNYFKSMIVKPQRFFKILNTVKKLGLFDKGISKFAASQMNNTKKRRRVYYSWVVFKELNFNLKEVANIFNDNQIKLEMYLGKYDKIITEKGMKRLLDQVNDYDLHLLESGHNNLIAHVAAFFKQNH